VNSAGLTDFNPDLRDALSSNVDSALHLLDFLRKSDRAGLMHLSTCYVVGMRDGRVTEELQGNYNPANSPDFDAEREVESLRETIPVSSPRRKPRAHQGASPPGPWTRRDVACRARRGTRRRFEAQSGALGT